MFFIQIYAYSSNSFCKSPNDEDVLSKLDANFMCEIVKILEPLIIKADRVISNQTTNEAERFATIYLINSN